MSESRFKFTLGPNLWHRPTFHAEPFRRLRDTTHSCEEISQLLPLPTRVSDFRCVASFRNYSTPEAKFRSGHISHVLTPAKIKKWCENCLSQNGYQSHAVNVEVLDFWYIAVFRNQTATKETAVENRVLQIYTFWHPPCERMIVVSRGQEMHNCDWDLADNIALIGDSWSNMQLPTFVIQEY